MNYKRKRFKSRSMRKCVICGSQRRIYGRPTKEKKLAKIRKKEKQ